MSISLELYVYTEVGLNNYISTSSSMNLLARSGVIHPSHIRNLSCWNFLVCIQERNQFFLYEVEILLVGKNKINTLYEIGLLYKYMSTSLNKFT